MRARTATVSDISEVIRLAIVMFEAVGADASDLAWQSHGRNRLTEGFADGTVAAFVVDHPSIAGRAISAAAVSLNLRLPTTLNPDGRIAYVQWVATDAEFRRRGASRAVMTALIEWVRTQGVSRIDLHASPDGLRLYRELGFEEPHSEGLVLPL